MIRIFLLLLLTPAFAAVAQSVDLDVLFADRPEVYFEFTAGSADEFRTISKMVSIDHGHDGTLKSHAYANRDEFARFLITGLPYTLEVSPGELIVSPKMMTLADVAAMESTGAFCTETWDAYPTYGAYEALMLDFAAEYPSICQYQELATLPSGRKILAVRISDNIGTDEGEPGVLYTSTMHGDETAGYPTALRLIAYLLCNYGSDAEVDNLVNNLDIWINPIANPDGTYTSNDNTITGATRGNANGRDLNRNFPDPQDGEHPDGNPYQAETIAFIDLADNYNFVMSSNWHGGAEVANYPWDTWSPRHADDDWWIHVMRNWANTVQAVSPSTYFDYLNNGITNGWDWYEVDGGRQDMMNYWYECREFTLEISNPKTPSAGSLPNYWNRQYQAMLDYLGEALNGIRGTVTDQSTGLPLVAEIFISGHDVMNSQVTSKYTGGKYYRPIKAGTYNLTFSAVGYISQTITGVNAADGTATILDVALVPSGGAVCNPPTGQNSNVLSASTVALSWNPIPGAQGYQVKGRPVGAPNFGQFQTAASSKNVGGLNSGETYEWQIRAKCADGTISPFTSLQTFTTLSPRMAENLSVFPNPAVNFIQIANQEGQQIEISDATGGVLKKETAVSNQHIIRISDLPAGLYLIHAGMATEKLIVE